MNRQREITIETPLGALRLFAEGDHVVGIYFLDHDTTRAGMNPAPTGAVGLAAPPAGEDGRGHPALEAVRAHLERYFAGEHALDAAGLPLAPRGSTFQLRVWRRLRAIPPGRTETYGSLARELGSSARAVGSANARNPLSIVVPCHRVIGQGGSLVGYAGGVERKRWLLQHESRTAAR